MYFFYFIITFFLSSFLTFLAITVMKKVGIVDKPKAQKRKIHEKEIPLGGGIAIFLSFFLVLALAVFGFHEFGKEVKSWHLLALLLGGTIVIIGGLLDDKFNLKPRYQIIFPVLASLIIIAFGIGPNILTNPLGTQSFNLNEIKVPVNFFGRWLLFTDIIVFFWLMGVMFTTKFLDGLDGLVSGTVAIGTLMIFFLSLQKEWYQPEVAILSIVFAGACLGFLVWNWHPAKIFLGEGGSLFTGFMLGSLAIISGSKIATTLLVLGIPMLDVVRVVYKRLKNHQPFYVGDNEHLHFKLLQSGFSQKQAVLLFYMISFLFGVTTLFLQSRQKMVALLFLLVLMMLIGFSFSKKNAV